MDRFAWLKQKRRESVQRMDELWSPIYDENWGATIEPSHRVMMEKFLNLCPPGGLLLDGACGTGKYWPTILQRSLIIHGIDQSRGMLARAREKHPTVQMELVGLQEMDFSSAFDAATCMDAMENVSPEDWPLVLDNFFRALKPGAPFYFTVEIAAEEAIAADFEKARQLGLPLVYGESAWEPGYHYYPEIERVREWHQKAGFRPVDESVGDSYCHFLVQKPMDEQVR
jgi:ubiquinone/menaquinone biosynthesis C-methylase UbiE